MHNQLSQLLEIVSEADRAVMEIYNSGDFTIEVKPDKTPVTQADLASNDVIISGLKDLFPDIPILSEENDRSESLEILKSETFWLVDPLDGTREFINRANEFTVCIGLIENNIPTFGIISAPALGVTYFGGNQMGSYKKVEEEDAVAIFPSDEEVGVVLTSHSFLNESTRNFIETHYANYEMKAVGSQLKLPYIAEGKADVYPRIDGPLHLWDLAAGHAILKAAGGTVKTPNQKEINYRTQNFLVGDFVASRKSNS